MPHRQIKSGFMKLDGTITVGNLITAGAALVSIAIGWGMLTARMDANDQRQAAQGLQFSQAIARIDEALKEQRTDQKDLAKAVQAITTDTALIRGRLASNDTQTSTRK
jgi:hypothetical protein